MLPRTSTSSRRSRNRMRSRRPAASPPRRPVHAARAKARRTTCLRASSPSTAVLGHAPLRRIDAAARRAAGAVIAAVDTVLAGKARARAAHRAAAGAPRRHARPHPGIGLVRPFCVFNSAMVAAAHALLPPLPPPAPAAAAAAADADDAPRLGADRADCGEHLRPPPPMCASAAWPSSILTCTTATARRRSCER